MATFTDILTIMVRLLLGMKAKLLTATHASIREGQLTAAHGTVVFAKGKHTTASQIGEEVFQPIISLSNHADNGSRMEAVPHADPNELRKATIQWIRHKAMSEELVRKASLRGF